MASKKIVFVIVEGTTDEDALSLMINKIFDKNTVHVHVVHGDITTDSFTTPINVLSRIHNMVSTYAKNYHLNLKTHFQQIVHILDTDGAYIPDEAIIYDEGCSDPCYSPQCIRVADVNGIVNRNKLKRECLERISTTKSIAGVPYQAYYMSCNLDHVLHNKLNSTESEKENDAMAFARKYRNDLEGFVRFISDSPFSVGDDYVESWKYIKDDCRSLERHTNFGICIKRARA